MVTVAGEFDLSTSSQLTSALTAERLLIDMAGVTFIDSTGLACLIHAKDQAADLVLISSPKVDRLLELAGLLEYFTGRTEKLE